MKKVILPIILAICLCVAPIIFSGCDSQLTMVQIYDAIYAEAVPAINGYDLKPVLINGFTYSELTKWQREFERNNIDTSDFMMLDKYYYDTSSDSFYQKSFYIYVFKFASTSATENCFNNYDFGNDYQTELYGNLIVVADVNISEYIFDIINKI